MAELNDNLDILIGGYIVSLSPELGRGSYGTVFKAMKKEDKKICVAKKNRFNCRCCKIHTVT